MTFIHEDPEFDVLLKLVAERHRLEASLVEKDYWVTHTLWALHQQGLEVWFKGGTSLSKGFRLIQRFSEDLDLKIQAGRTALPSVTNWKSERQQAVASRRAHFDALAQTLVIPGAAVTMMANRDARVRSADLRVDYPGTYRASLSPVMRPFVLLEVGSARVTPFLERDMSSFVHDHLAREGQLAGYADNRPSGVRCVHPMVTLLEKLDAIMKRLPRESTAPTTFVRHFEDAARIIGKQAGLPPLASHGSARALAEDMLLHRQIKELPDGAHPAFQPDDGERWREVRSAHAAIGAMFWGPRMSIEESCARIRGWIAAELAPAMWSGTSGGRGTRGIGRTGS